MPAEIIFNFKKKIRKIYLNEFIEKYSNSLKDNFLLEVQNTGVQKVFRLIYNHCDYYFRHNHR